MFMHKEIPGVWGQHLLLFLLFVQQNSESQYFFLRFTYYHIVFCLYVCLLAIRRNQISL